MFVWSSHIYSILAFHGRSANIHHFIRFGCGFIYPLIPTLLSWFISVSLINLLYSIRRGHLGGGLSLSIPFFLISAILKTGSSASCCTSSIPDFPPPMAISDCVVLATFSHSTAKSGPYSSCEVPSVFLFLCMYRKFLILLGCVVGIQECQYRKDVFVLTWVSDDPFHFTMGPGPLALHVIPNKF